MPYRILHDYGSDGFRFEDGEYNTADEAVQQALRLNYGVPFVIVRMVEWVAKETTD